MWRLFGQVEPNAHVRDYFVGDGFTTKFYLFADSVHAQ